MTASPTGHPRGFAALAVLLVTAVVVVVSVVLTAAAFNLTTSDTTAPAEDDQSRAIATAEQFCLRVDAFDGDDPDGYRKSVTALLTTKYKAEFDKQFAEIEKLGVQKGQKGKGNVLASGIATIDQDSATVLVVHDNTITSAAGSGQQHSRWTVTLDKVGGRWLVDDFTPVS